jgi:hypothetical protein
MATLFGYKGGWQKKVSPPPPESLPGGLPPKHRPPPPPRTDLQRDIARAYKVPYTVVAYNLGDEVKNYDERIMWRVEGHYTVDGGAVTWPVRLNVVATSLEDITQAVVAVVKQQGDMDPSADVRVAFEKVEGVGTVWVECAE